MNGHIPDISQLRVFGYAAYVYILKETRINALSPKSELMVYLGHTEGIKAYTFIRISNNTVYTSTTALFDETLFPKCDTSHTRGTTCIRVPPNDQPPFDASEDTTPGNFDNPLPSPKKSKVPLPDEAPAASNEKPAREPTPAPPITPEPVPLRRSARLRKVPTRPGNVYRLGRHPTEIEKDITQKRTWTRMTDLTSGPFETPMTGEFDPSALSETPQPDSLEEDEVDDILHLTRKGRVKILDYLLAKAVPHADSESPDTANIHE